MFIPGFMVRRKRFPGLLLLALVALSPALLYAIERLSFKPGFNLFTPQQDVEVGQKSAAEVNKQLPLIRDVQVVGYINGLGKSLAKAVPAKPQKVDYEWTFNVVNSSDINAFALPGGFIYVNRGAIDAARNEAQIAGVIAHEEGHVVMRHGTHQASEMMLAQAPLAILGGLLGQSSSLGSQLAELGISFGVNSIFLRNSRSAESQADQVGTYILYHAGYDPYAMAQFFEIIQKKYPQQTIQFLSDHPNPGNRIRNVDQEISLLGPKRDGKTDSPEFEAVKKRLESMPPAPPPPKSAR
jgi:predicted Zn-dependent protease